MTRLRVAGSEPASTRLTSGDAASAESRLAQALDFRRLGRRVFPVKLIRKNDGSWDKRPCVTGYHGDRPYTEADLRRMPWSGATHLGMALYLGEVALDFDIKNGGRAREHLVQLETVYGPLPRTVGQTTLSGGWHWLYRAQLPRRLVGRLTLPDGSATAIDVIHSRNRFLVLYQPELLLRTGEAFAELPPAWCQALNRALSVPTARVGSHGSHAVQGISALIDEVRACEDRRNETLNRNTFLAVMSGACTEADLARFRAAATSGGLPEDEVDRTMSSAVSAATRAWAMPSAWYLEVKSSLLASDRRDRTVLIDAAAVFALTAARTGKSTVGMSVRALAEGIGVSPESARLIMRRLCDGGWLERLFVRRCEALRYQLISRTTGSMTDSHPRLFEGRLSPFDAADLLRLRLRRLSAFQRLGGGPVLTPGALAVCVALTAGAHSRATLAQETGLSRSTISRAVLILESAGVIAVHGGVVRLVADEVGEALNGWAVAMRVDGRPEFRARRHELQRQAYSSRQANLDAAVAKVTAAQTMRREPPGGEPQ